MQLEIHSFGICCCIRWARLRMWIFEFLVIFWWADYFLCCKTLKSAENSNSCTEQIQSCLWQKVLLLMSCQPIKAHKMTILVKISWNCFFFRRWKSSKGLSFCRDRYPAHTSSMTVTLAVDNAIARFIYHRPIPRFCFCSRFSALLLWLIAS